MLSEPARPSPGKAVMELWKENAAVVATAAPIWHELVYGVERLVPSKKKTTLQNFIRSLEGLPILGYNQESAAGHALARAGLERVGRPIGWVDGQIAAIAVAHGLVLVTRNQRHFEHYPGLSMENWFED